MTDITWRPLLSEMLVSSGNPDLPILEELAASDPQQQFAQNYNRSSFMFRHGLSGHPLFQLPSLIELARRQGDRPGYAYWSNGAVDVNDRWEKGVSERSLTNTIADIGDNDSLVILKHTEQDPVFGPVLTKLLSRLVALSGEAMSRDMIVGRTTILIASPRRITTYHIDADVNFLFQVTGDKMISVFDQTDRTHVTEDELERYHAGDSNGAVFKPARQDDAKIYDLRAGCGIHIPSTAPHWAQNHDSISVALSFNYDLRSVQQTARIYSLNRRLRRLGIDPAPPGRAAWRDRMKLMTAHAIETARHLRGRPPSVQPPPAG
jgi:hypothetical protein